MRLERLALKGLSSAFPDLVELSLRDLPPGLVAITGANGEGKTFLLEAPAGGLYRQLPARNGDDPVTYAISRDAFIEHEFSVDGRGAFRSRLNLDGPKRQTDAVLEMILADGTRVPLNPDGKRSTYDAVIKDKFPSFDLFINSAFAAQGRGDEFTRRKPSQRKDLFVEFLALQHYAVKAKAAADAADLASDACLRLTARVEPLQRDTAAALLEQIERQVQEQQATGDQAAAQRTALQTSIADIEARLALLTDQVAANAAATQRVQQVERELLQRRTDRRSIDVQRQAAIDALARELARVTSKRDADVADADKRIAGNQQILSMRQQIEEAVTATADAEIELTELRAELSQRQAEQQQAEAAVRDIEKAIAALVPVEHRLERSTRDAGLLDSVPCGGAGEYAACQFLVDAAHAKAQLEDLTAKLEPKAALADRLSAGLKDVERRKQMVTAVTGRISGLQVAQAKHAPNVKYSAPLLEATTKIAGYQDARAKALADAEQLAGEAQARHDARIAELVAQAVALDAQIATLTSQVERAQADLQETAAGNSQAAQLQAELTAGRREWDIVTTTLATVDSARQALEHRREEWHTKRALLTDLEARHAGVQQELVEWRDLAKALGKGGLPDLEIDQAGPTISALTNEILLDCFGPRFSIELVTQVEKVDGGMKDEFTVRVMDNAASGGWRDIYMLSGGQKVIVQEALMCAISIFVNQRSEMPIRTLWRDETGAALDAEHAIHYVRMLRKVRELGGYFHVFFISHDPAVQALADAQIQVGGGRASIVLPPFTEAA